MKVLSANITRTRPIDFDLGVKYVQNSLSVTSAEFALIQAAAAEHNIAVSLGFSERDGESVYISQAMISAEGTLTSKRRKMKPTHMERTIFGDATGGECLVPPVDVGCPRGWKSRKPQLLGAYPAAAQILHLLEGRADPRGSLAASRLFRERLAWFLLNDCRRVLDGFSDVCC